MDKLLKVEDIQEILNIKKSKAYELVNTPGFPAIRIGAKMIRIPQEDFEQWIKAYTGKTFKLLGQYR